MDMIADTNLVIALEREARRGLGGPAHEFVAAHAQDRFFITFTVSGEIACGDSATRESDWVKLCEPYGMLEWRSDVSLQYGRLYRHLKATGNLIGTNDMWIAAAALAYQMPLVTNNRSEFGRVPRLMVLPF